MVRGPVRGAGQRPDQLRGHLGQGWTGSRPSWACSGRRWRSCCPAGSAPGRRGCPAGNAEYAAPSSQPCGSASSASTRTVAGSAVIDRQEHRIRHQVLVGRVEVVQVPRLVGQLEEVLGEQQLAGHLAAPDGRLSIRHWWPTSCRPNRWVSGFCPSGAGMYWPVALTAPSSLRGDLDDLASSASSAAGAAPPTRPAAPAITVTAGPGPGCQDGIRRRGQVLPGDRVVVGEVRAGQDEVLHDLRPGSSPAWAGS